MSQNYGLGRGLSSLIPPKKISEPQKDFNYFGVANAPVNSAKGEEKSTGVEEVDVFRIGPNPHQPRLRFDEEKLQELAASIKEHGIIQPITVTKNGNQYEIIAGERRLQAARLAGLKKVPVIVREAGELAKLELAIIENVHRHDLNPIEEAKSYLKLTEEFDLNQEDLSRKMGKSRSAIANKLRLLRLPVEIQKALAEGKISEGHAKAILAIENPEKQRALFEMILKGHLTVRQTESKTKEVEVKKHTRSVHIDPQLKSLEDRLAEKLGTKVKIAKAGNGGKILIDYYSEEELQNIIGRIEE